MAIPHAQQKEPSTTLPAVRVFGAMIGIIGLFGFIAQPDASVDSGSPEAAPPALLVQTD